MRKKPMAVGYYVQRDDGALLGNYARECSAQFDLATLYQETQDPIHMPFLARRMAGKLQTALIDSEATVLLLAEVSTLFRDPLDFARQLVAWLKAGIDVRLVGDGDLTLHAKAGRYYELLLKIDGAKISARTQAAVAVRKEKGKRTGGVPYGFAVGPGTKLLPLEEEQAVIRAMQKARDDRGLSYAQIATELNNKGIPARGSKWHKTSVIRVLARVP